MQSSRRGQPNDCGLNQSWASTEGRRPVPPASPILPQAFLGPVSLPPSRSEDGDEQIGIISIALPGQNRASRRRMRMRRVLNSTCGPAAFGRERSLETVGVHNGRRTVFGLRLYIALDRVVSADQLNFNGTDGFHVGLRHWLVPPPN